MRSSFSTMSTAFWDFGLFSLVPQSQRILVIDPLPSHLTVATSLHCRPFLTRVGDCIRGPKPLGALSSTFFPFPFSFPVYCREFHTIKCANVTNFFSSASAHLFLSLIHSSFLAQSVAILSHTFPRLCHLHLCFHTVWLHGSSLIPLACMDCHLLVLLHLETLYMVSITAWVLLSHTLPWLTTDFRQSLHLGPGPIFTP